MTPTLHNDRVETSKAPLHVLIIGGGIGGLCLAQGLKKSGIKVAVYERDHSADFRGQGYRNSLNADGSRALRDCLPENLFHLCVATSIKSATRMVFLDHQLNQKFVKPILPLPADSFFGVHRLTLREILLAGLEDTVHFGKTFERFEQLDDEKIRAFFTDGTFATGDLLVGADGTHSVVRDLIVPDARIDTLDYAIYGKTPILPDMLEWVPEILVDGFVRIVSLEGTGMGLATCRQVESAASALAKFDPTPHLTDVPGYFSWTLSLPEAFRNADGPALHQLARTMVKGWHPALLQLIDEADIPATFPVRITSARPVKPWHTPNVTLLGDAIHTMSPGRGEGANTALRDAALLRHALVEAEARGIPFVQAKIHYETTMLHYGFEAVAKSLEHPFAFSANRGEADQQH